MSCGLDHLSGSQLGSPGPIVNSSARSNLHAAVALHHHAATGLLH